MKPKLIFVYNANSDILSSLKDSIIKKVAPSKYTCNLCMITFDDSGMKKEWSDFVSKLDFETEFLHKDEFLEKYNPFDFTQGRLPEIKLPAIIKKDDKLEILVSNSQINQAKTVKDLMELVEGMLLKNPS